MSASHAFQISVSRQVETSTLRSPWKLRSQKSIRIAIADDQSIFRHGLRSLLMQEQGFEIVGETQDGAGVMKILEEEAPDILLMDPWMPGVDGLSLLERIQAQKFKTKIILLTAAHEECQHVKAMQLGISGIVFRQTATELLFKSIRKVYDGEIWLDSKTTAAVIREFASQRDSRPSNHTKPLLSERERELIALVAQGLKNKEIAARMFISEQTVKNHLYNICRKLRVSGRLELALYAFQHNVRAERNQQT